MRRITLANDNYYHVFNRGVDKRPVFTNKDDYKRFLYLLYACNDTKPVLNSSFYYQGLTSIVEKERKKQVEIVCFCLMQNHYHLLLHQIANNGISCFMQKLGTGYTMYFNIKYGRSGSLFQGTFKAKHIDTETYLTHLTRYIHLNPAELKEPNWKKKGTKNPYAVHEYIKNYPWSSYRHYLGEEEMGKIIDVGLMQELYSPQEYERFIHDWETKDLESIAVYTFSDD